MSSVVSAYPWLADLPGFREEAGGFRCTTTCAVKCHRSGRTQFTLGESGCLLIKCWANCDPLEILRALGKTWKDCWPGGNVPDQPKQVVAATYPYVDENEQLLYVTVRMYPGRNGKDKDFRQKRPKPGGGWDWSLGEVRRVLYRLPDLLSADPAAPVFVVGGEKDADSLRKVGVVATTNVCGENARWLPEYSATLSGRHCIVIEDADSAGARHTDEVCGSLMRTVASLRRGVMPDPLKDATAVVSHLRHAGVTDPAEIRGHLFSITDEFPLWEPRRT